MTTGVLCLDPAATATTTRPAEIFQSDRSSLTVSVLLQQRVSHLGEILHNEIRFQSESIERLIVPPHPDRREAEIFRSDYIEGISRDECDLIRFPTN